MQRVAQHRAVMDTLADEFAAGLHALAIDVLDPDKAATPPADTL
jgi:stress-induced morphogen